MSQSCHRLVGRRSISEVHLRGWQRRVWPGDRTRHRVTMRTGEGLFWAAIDLALLWRVWRRSAAARYVLIVLIGLPAFMLVLSLTELGWLALVLLALATVELPLLFTPQVRSHVTGRRARLQAQVDR